MPGIVSIMALSYIYAAFGSVPAIAALFLGLKAAVLAIVLQAVQRVGSRALKSRPMFILAALAFIGIFFFAVPFPLIVIAAGLIGFVAARAGSTAFQVGGDHGGGGKAGTDEGLLGAELPEHARPSVSSGAARLGDMAGSVADPGSRDRLRGSAATTSSPRSACSSRKWPW